MSLELYLPLHDGENGTATDYSGNDNHGTVNGATTGVAGRGGLQAMSFDGVDDNIEYPYTSQSVPFTFCAWVKTRSPSNTQAIYNNFNGTSDDLIFRYASGSLEVVYDNGVSVSGGSSANEWQFVAVVIEPSRTSLYIDGEQVASATGTNNGPVDSGANWQTGYYPNAQGGALDGVVSNARIYSRALSDREVYNLYQTASVDAARPPTDYTAYYKLDGDVTDETGNYDGTNNGVTFTSDAIRGQAGDFVSGEGDYISLGQLGGLSGEITVSAWAKVSADGRIIARYSGNVGDDNSGAVILDRNGGDWRFSAFTSGDAEVLISASSVDSEWVLLTAVIDGSGGMTLYENAQVVTTGDLGESLVNNTSEWTIGSDADGTSNVSANIDDVRIYPYALEPYEVHDLYRWGTFGRDLRKRLVTARS